ncbi:hypothetical protein NPIL_128201 [Nephila pilipes]|uniref:Uncharacterized protein n=1 Tax=Nephila pilipes TaxID=299642 RepID=A0A8X6PAK0_NEPPI|nr:hypothetical protein NPIL_128201 [Nephila pilipes]
MALTYSASCARTGCVVRSHLRILLSKDSCSDGFCRDIGPLSARYAYSFCFMVSVPKACLSLTPYMEGGIAPLWAHVPVVLLERLPLIYLSCLLLCHEKRGREEKKKRKEKERKNVCYQDI